MDELWSAPAKVNLTVRVRRPQSDGYHPIESIVQAVDWEDDLRFTDSDEDDLDIEGGTPELPTGRDNLIWKAIRALELESRAPLVVRLTKRIPSGAGLGGGSSDAACAIAAVGDRYRVSALSKRRVAASVGADVSFFLEGGTAMLEGVGEHVTRLDPFHGFVVVIAAPEFPLSTPGVYRTWDELGYPSGRPVEPNRLPPSLRSLEVVNDLEPAALSLRPELGDVINELASEWDRPVIMSGSGSAVFAFFADLDEAEHAVRAGHGGLAMRACSPIDCGVRSIQR